MLTKNDLGQIREIIKEEIKVEINPLKKDVRTLKSDVSAIRIDVKQIVSFFDKEYLDLRQRVENIEQHLGITSPV